MKKYIGMLALLVISQSLQNCALADVQYNSQSWPISIVNPTLSGYTSLLDDQDSQDSQDSSTSAPIKKSNFNNTTSQDINLDSKNANQSKVKPSQNTLSKDNKIDTGLALDNFNLSDIEKIFNTPQSSSQNTLRQFGYDLLGHSYNYSYNDKVGKDYKLNTGDKINIIFSSNSALPTNYGSNNLKNTSVTIDKNGRIFISGAGSIQAKGKTLSDLEQQIKKALTGKISNQDIKVTLNNPDSIPVFVMGNVKQPGIVYVSPSATVFDALNLAGGINKDGSFREIQYINSVNKSKKTIDLYDALINGNISNIQLKNKDVILVKPIGKVVALASGVKHPAIYEFKTGENLKNIVNYDGGFLPTINTDDIQVESFDAAKNQKSLSQVNQTELSKIFVKDGDFIQFKNLYNVAENIIVLEGNVKNPGRFQYKKGMKLSDIIKSKDDLLTNTYLYQAVINRKEGDDRESANIPISLVDFFKGSINPELKPMDTIKIYTSTKMQSVEIAGSVTNPGGIPYKSGMTLKDILSVANFDITPNNLAAEISNPSDNSGDVKIVYLYNMLKNKDISNDQELKAGDKIMFRPITSKEIIKTVKILGNVNNPGIYKVYPGMKIKEAIKIAGGLSPNAYLKGLSFYRPSLRESQKRAMENSILKLQENISMKVNTLESISDINKKTDLTRFIDNQQNLINVLKEKSAQDYGRININITSNNLDNLTDYENFEIQDGDEIYVPSMPQHVSIMGEVYNQSVVAYNPDKSVEYYINNLGGLTKQANKKEIYIIKADGSATKVKNLITEFPEPGDTIIIPRKIVIPLNITSIIKDFTQIGFNALNTIFILTKI